MTTVRLLFFAAMLCLSVPGFVSAAAPGCPPAGHDLADLAGLKERHFDIRDARERHSFARNLLPCLYDPDANLRDRIAYEAYATWRYDKALDADTWRFIESSLLTTLTASKPDPDGVMKPFAALVLAEAVKANRAAPFLSETDQESLLNAAAGYLIALRDYRGFDSDVGWRHGVAHGADLLGQLALLPAVGKTGMDRILSAITMQITPADTHFYVFGEGERLAAVVVAIASRDVYTADEWSAWLTNIVRPVPYASWDRVYWSEAGLAKRHDTMGFLLALYAQTATDKRLPVSSLAPMVFKAMEPLG